MDIGISFGTDLFAAVGGKVIFAGPRADYRPNHVRIETDDGEIHIYGHMSRIGGSVSTGSRIETGEFLGKSGTENGDHLHFERRVPGNCTSGYCAVECDSVLVEGGVPPAAFGPADLIKVAAQSLRLRDAPGLHGAIIEELDLDIALCVASGPQQADGFNWYEVTRRDTAVSGWVAGRYCELVEAQGC
jgi:hypothetical protein